MKYGSGNMVFLSKSSKNAALIEVKLSKENTKNCPIYIIDVCLQVIY